MRTLRTAAVASLLSLTAFVRGPAWISIEYPANPYDNASRGAFLLVHAFHHGTPVGFPVAGNAEGIVDGARRTISLELKSTTRPGVYAVHKQWPDQGVWTLILNVTQGKGEGNVASAIVELAANGQVASVNVPSRMKGSWLIPDRVNMADVEASLRARASRLAAK